MGRAMITSEQIEALKQFLRVCPEHPQDAPVEAVNPALADLYRSTLYIQEPLEITEAEAVQTLDNLLKF
jgi:hypothetical protein